LGERDAGSVEARGSSPLTSTKRLVMIGLALCRAYRLPVASVHHRPGVRRAGKVFRDALEASRRTCRL
jgi:hypothetical protein